MWCRTKYLQMWFPFVTLKESLFHFISRENKCACSAISGDGMKQRVWWKPFLLFNNESGSSWSGPEDTDIGGRDSLGYSNQSVYPHCKPRNANTRKTGKLFFSLKSNYQAAFPLTTLMMGGKKSKSIFSHQRQSLLYSFWTCRGTIKSGDVTASMQCLYILIEGAF